MNTIKALLVALKDRNIPETSPESMRLLNIQAVATDILKGLIDWKYPRRFRVMHQYFRYT